MSADQRGAVRRGGEGVSETGRTASPWLRVGKAHVYVDRWGPSAWQVVRTVDGPGFVIDLGHLSVAVTWGAWS